MQMPSSLNWSLRHTWCHSNHAGAVLFYKCSVFGPSADIRRGAAINPGGSPIAYETSIAYAFSAKTRQGPS